MIGRATLPERVLFHWVSGLVLLKVLLILSFRAGFNKSNVICSSICRRGLSLYKRCAPFLHYGSEQRENFGFSFDSYRHFYVESSSAEGFYI